jgi:hypothetical protein
MAFMRSIDRLYATPSHPLHSGFVDDIRRDAGRRASHNPSCDCGERLGDIQRRNRRDETRRQRSTLSRQGGGYLDDGMRITDAVVDPHTQIPVEIGGEYRLIYLERDEAIHGLLDIRRI